MLERLATAQDRENYLQSRREIRGRPKQRDGWRRLLKKRYKGDLKADADAGLELSDYDVVSLHIPYGPGWDARRIEKLVYQTVSYEFCSSSIRVLIQLHRILA